MTFSRDAWFNELDKLWELGLPVRWTIHFQHVAESLAGYVDGDGFCYPRKQTLAATAHASERTVDRACAVLHELKLVSWTTPRAIHGGDGRWRQPANRYQLAVVDAAVTAAHWIARHRTANVTVGKVSLLAGCSSTDRLSVRSDVTAGNHRTDNVSVDGRESKPLSVPLPTACRYGEPSYLRRSLEAGVRRHSLTDDQITQLLDLVPLVVEYATTVLAADPKLAPYEIPRLPVHGWWGCPCPTCAAARNYAESHRAAVEATPVLAPTPVELDAESTVAKTVIPSGPSTPATETGQRDDVRDALVHQQAAWEERLDDWMSTLEGSDYLHLVETQGSCRQFCEVHQAKYRLIREVAA